MNTHVISTSDTYEVTFYLMHGYNINTVNVIPKSGNLVCIAVIEGDEKLKDLQEVYFSAPVVNLNDFRNSLNRVKSLFGAAKYKARQEFTEKNNKKNTALQINKGGSNV